MKKSDWIYLARAMWEYSEKHEGKISSLLKQLIKEINNNKEMITDDMGEYEQNVTSNRPIDTDAANSSDYERLGRFYDK
tara:strand:- start:985 stop:1221 length:237 start_codon:yes stop_codon:yes gene_type:complete